MQITFVSNYINHHQIPVSDELFRLTNGSYTFIQTEPMEEERIKMGWDVNSINKPYVKLFYDDEEGSKQLIMDSDCVIFGGTEREELIEPRLLANKLTIHYSERIYKESRLKFVSPRGLKKKYHDHVRFNKSNVYLLCAGAYVKGDFDLIHAYPHKKLKFGYFPEFVRYTDLNENRKDNKELSILWAARFIDWKHPEMMIRLAKCLKNDGIKAHITMIGNGELLESTKRLATDSDVNDYITFEGSKTPSEVREYMRAADIFISTSDRLEGWGAVVNEAMNSGCVTIAARDIGAAPYLIKNGDNGFMYKAKSDKNLYETVKKLAGDEALRNRIGIKAYETIETLWNPEVAAGRLYDFITSEPKDLDKYKDGPLSRA